MATAWNRMHDLTKQLTARERAVLWLRAWRDGKQPDSQVGWSMPPDQKPEYERLIDLVGVANDHTLSTMAMLRRFTIESDIHLAWAESLLAWEARRAALTARLGEAGVRVREQGPGSRKGAAVLLVEPLPAATHGVTADMPLVFRTAGEPAWNASPPAGAELPGVLLKEAGRNVSWRWAELAAMEEVLMSLSEREFQGEPTVHPEVERFLAILRDKLERMGASLGALGRAADYPAPTEAQRLWAYGQLEVPPPPEAARPGVPGGVDRERIEQTEAAMADWKDEAECQKREGGPWRLGKG